MVQGIKAVGGVVSSSMIALGIAAAGFLAYNKLDDLKDALAEGWEDGFGLKADPSIVQDNVANYTTPNEGWGSGLTPDEFAGMSVHTIYQIHYDERDRIIQWVSQEWCGQNGLEWTGKNHARFLQETAGRSSILTTYRFERNEIIDTATSANEISEYTYQMIIRETASRNTQARATSGIIGAASTGIGALFSEATHWALRSSGFMQSGDWDGQNWHDAPSANFDRLLGFAWARTDFQTQQWWSTADSIGDVAFWLERQSGVDGYDLGPDAPPNPEGFERWSYEQVIHLAFQELEAAEFRGPALTNILASIGLDSQTQTGWEAYVRTLNIQGFDWDAPVTPAVPTGETHYETDPVPDQDDEKSEGSNDEDDYMDRWDEDSAPPPDREDEPPRQGE